MLTGKPKGPAAINPASLAADVRFRAGNMVVAMTDGRSVSIPLPFYPTLAAASPAQRRDYQLLGDGRAIHWPSLDLDLSVDLLLAGAREGIPKPPPLSKLRKAH